MDKPVFPSWRLGLGLGLIAILATVRDDLSSYFVQSLQPAVRPESVVVMAALTGAMVLLAQALQVAFARGFSTTWGASPVAQSLFGVPIMALAGAAMAEPTAGVSLSVLLLPFVFAAIGLAAMVLSRRPSVRWTRELMTGLSLFRWYYLGGLLGTASSQPWLKPLPEDLIVYAAIFLSLHMATRKVRRVDTARFPEGLDSLLAAYDSLSVGILVELCLILPLSLILGGASRLSPADGLPLYLALMTANALLLKWTVEGPNPAPTGYERLVGSVYRVLTVLVGLLTMPVLLVRFQEPGLAPALTLLAMGLLRGRPWGSQLGRRLPPDTPGAVVSKPGFPLGRGFWQAMGAALFCLGVAFVSLELPSQEGQSSPLSDARHSLRATNGWRFRIHPTTEGSAILACQRGSMWDSWLPSEEISRAEAAVAQVLPQVRLSPMEVRPGVWEALAEVLSLAFVLVQFGLLGIISGKISPPESRNWSRGLLLLAGCFGALGMASVWGWLWLNPHSLFLVFSYLTFLSWGDPRTFADRGKKTLEALRASWERVRGGRPPVHSESLVVILGRNLWEVPVGVQEKVRESTERLGIPRVMARVLRDDRGEPDQYRICLGSLELGRGTLRLGARLLVGPASRVAPFGTPFAESTHGMPAVWVDSAQVAPGRPVEGCRCLDPGEVLGEHLSYLALKAYRERPLSVLTTEELSERFRLRIVGTV